MRASIESCFPNARRVVDRFHVQQEVCTGLNEIRMKAKHMERKLELRARKKHKTKLKQRLKRRKKDKTDPRSRKPKKLNEAFIPEKLSNGLQEFLFNILPLYSQGTLPIVSVIL